MEKSFSSVKIIQCPFFPKRFISCSYLWRRISFNNVQTTACGVLKLWVNKRGSYITLHIHSVAIFVRFEFFLLLRFRDYWQNLWLYYIYCSSYPTFSITIYEKKNKCIYMYINGVKSAPSKQKLSWKLQSVKVGTVCEANFL